MDRMNQLTNSSSFEQKFEKIDPQLTKLIKQLLEFNPANRATAKECLSNPMFENLARKSPEKQKVNFKISTVIDGKNAPTTL